MILVLVCLVTAVLFVWLLLEFAGRAFGELTMSPRSNERLGLAGTPAMPTGGPGGPAGGSPLVAPSPAAPSPRPLVPTRAPAQAVAAAARPAAASARPAAASARAAAVPARAAAAAPAPDPAAAPTMAMAAVAAPAAAPAPVATPAASSPAAAPPAPAAHPAPVVAPATRRSPAAPAPPDATVQARRPAAGEDGRDASVTAATDPGAAESGGKWRNVVGISRARRRSATEQSDAHAVAPEPPRVEESVTVISRTRRPREPLNNGNAAAAEAGAEESNVPRVIRAPKHAPVASLLPTTAEPSTPAPEIVESRQRTPNPPAWALTPKPDPPASPPAPATPNPSARALTPTPHPPAAPNPMPDVLASLISTSEPAVWPPAPAPTGATREPEDWPDTPAQSGPGAPSGAFSSSARRAAAIVGSRAREAILGFPPPPGPPVPGAVRDPFAGRGAAPAPGSPGTAGLRTAGAEPAPGQTVVLVGDDVEAWVRERLYGGRLPDR